MTPWTAVLLTACAVVGCALYALDPMNVAGALAGHGWRATTTDADPNLESVESAKPAKAAGDGARDSRDTRGRRGSEEDGGVDDVPREGPIREGAREGARAPGRAREKRSLAEFDEAPKGVASRWRRSPRAGFEPRTRGFKDQEARARRSRDDEGARVEARAESDLEEETR